MDLTEVLRNQIVLPILFVIMFCLVISIIFWDRRKKSSKKTHKKIYGLGDVLEKPNKSGQVKYRSEGYKTGKKEYDDLVDFYSIPGTLEREKRYRNKNKHK